MRTLVTLLLLSASGLAQGGQLTLQFDDFNDGVLDTSLWSAVTNGIPGASVTETGGQALLANRGYLASAAGFDADALGGVRIDGRASFPQVAGGIATLSVVVRSDATPGPAPFEVQEGVEMRLVFGPAQPVATASFLIHGTSLTLHSQLDQFLTWVPGASYEVRAIDAPWGFSLEVFETGQPLNYLILTGSITGGTSSSQRIVFHGSGGGGSGDQVLALDEMRISADDCNGNGVADGVDLFNGTSQDCDGNALPDECDLQNPSKDLNRDGILDACQCQVSRYCTATTNSTGLPAEINHTGMPSFQVDNLVILVDHLPPASNGLFLGGSSPTQTPFWDGFRCVGGPLVRLRTASTQSGAIGWFVDLNSLPPAYGAQPGVVRYMQFWFRDTAAGGTGANLSDALELHFCL
jgi:hypothetical protein